MNLINNCVVEITNKMSEVLNNEELKKLEGTLWIVLNKYKIQEEETSLVVYDDYNMRLLNTFINTKKLEGLSDNSLTQYEYYNRRLLEKLNTHVENVTVKNLRAYLAWYEQDSFQRRGKELSKTTLQNMIHYIASFFNWLEDEEYIIKSPARALKPIKRDKVIKKPFSDEETERIKNATDCKRDLALIEFLYSTGCRVSEVMRLNVGDIDFDRNVCIVFGKGNKERTVYISETAMFYLKKYLNSRSEEYLQPNSPLFLTSKKVENKYHRLDNEGIRYILHKIGNIAHIDNVHPHRFRRTLACRLINRNVPIQEVKEILGHEKIETTMMYCNISNDNVKLSHKKFA